MAILKVLQYPDKRLRQVAQPVEDFGDATQKLIDDMFETLYASENTAGYAATQMNIQQQIIVIDLSELKNEPLCVINPEFLEKRGETFEPEGCLSVPGGVYEKVKRAEYVKVRAMDRHGKPFEIESDTFLSRCLQHENDHLNGKLFIDHLSPLKRQMIDKKLAKLRKQGEL